METAPEGPGNIAEADAALEAAINSAVSEAPEEEVQALAAEPAAESEQPRDELGRFAAETPKDEPEASLEAPAESPETPVEPTEPAEGLEPDAEDLPDEPFIYRADGQDFEIPGSAVGDDGVFIPKDHLPEVQHLLSAGKAAFGSVRQRLSESATREQQALDRAVAAEAQAQHVLGHFEDLISKGPEVIQQWLLNMHQNWPILQAEAKAKAIELRNQQATKELERYRDQENQARLRPLMEQTLQQSIRTQGTQLGLDEQTVQAIHRQLSQPQYEKLLFVKAPYDDPGSGIRQGDLVIDHSVVASALQLASIHRPAQVQQQKIAAAQAQNAKRTPQKVKVPPTVAKGRAPTGGGVPSFATQKDADQWFENGGFMDLELEE